MREFWLNSIFLNQLAVNKMLQLFVQSQQTLMLILLKQYVVQNMGCNKQIQEE